MTTYPPLQIPETLAAGPGPGNTDPRVLERFAKTGLADHMQKDVLRGMIEAKEMLRELWGTKNVYTPTASVAQASAGSIACCR